MSHFTYLSIPCSGVDHESLAWSLEAVYVYSKNGVPCYSPILQYLPAVQKYELPSDYDFWRPMDEAIIRACGALHVIVPKDWEKLIVKSKAVNMETRFAHGLGKHVHVISLDRDDSKIHTDEAEIMDKLLYG